MTITVDRQQPLMLVGINGACWSTDMGATAPSAPSDPSVMPGAGWTPMGAVTQDGLSEGFAEDRQDIFVWGVLTPFRTLTTSSTRTFTLGLAETSRDLCKSLMFRQPLSAMARTGDIRSFADSSTPTIDRRAFLFKAIDGAVVQQYYVPLGEITDRQDVAHNSQGPTIYQITISTYPDASGNTVYMTDNAPATEAGSGS